MQIPLGTVPQFGLLQDILLYGTEPHALFVFTEMETVGYNGNLGAYELMALAEYSVVIKHLFAVFILSILFTSVLQQLHTLNQSLTLLFTVIIKFIFHC